MNKDLSLEISCYRGIERGFFVCELLMLEIDIFLRHKSIFRTFFRLSGRRHTSMRVSACSSYVIYLI